MDRRRCATRSGRRRRDHRREHGLSGEEGLQSGRGIGVAARRSAGRANSARGGRGGVRSGDREDSHRLVAGAAQRRRDCTNRRRRGRCVDRGSRPHARVPVHGRRRIRHDRCDQGGRAAFRCSPTATSPRRAGASRARAHRRRRRVDRPRGAGRAVVARRHRDGACSGRAAARAFARRSAVDRGTALAHIHDFYGAEQGVRIARKHAKAYLQGLAIDACGFARSTSSRRRASS